MHTFRGIFEMCFGIFAIKVSFGSIWPSHAVLILLSNVHLPWEKPMTNTKYIETNLRRSPIIIRYIITTNGPTVLKPRQKKRKYGAVVSMTTTASISSTLSAQESLRNGKDMRMQHEKRNITLEGAVIWKIDSINNYARHIYVNFLKRKRVFCHGNQAMISNQWSINLPDSRRRGKNIFVHFQCRSQSLTHFRFDRIFRLKKYNPVGNKNSFFARSRSRIRWK